VRTFLQKYGTKVVKDPAKPPSEKPEEKWKDYADIVRYAAMVYRPYEYWREMMVGIGANCREWEMIKARRRGEAVVVSRGDRVMKAKERALRPVFA